MDGGAPISDSKRLEIATRAASLGVWDWNLITGEFTYSLRAREIFGFTPDEPVTLEKVRAATHPEDLPRTWEMSRRALDPLLRASEPYLYRVIRADDGALRWILAHGEAIFEETNGELHAIRYIGTAQDVTEQKLAEQALADSEARLRLAIEASGIAVWEIDLATGRIAHSPELNRICGFLPDARPSLEEFRARYAPGEHERIQREGAEMRARGERKIATQFRYLWPDGSERWLAMRAQVAPGETGYEGRVIGVLMDITEQKRTEERFREMADNAPVMVWVTDAEDQCTFMSKSWYEFTGQSEGEALGGGWLEAVHPEDRHEVRLASLEATQGAGSYRVEYRLRHRDGAFRRVLDAAAPRYDARGTFLGHIGSVIDITDIREAAEQRQILIGELNHRLKNAFGIVSALAKQTFRSSHDADARLEAFNRRLQALAEANEIGISERPDVPGLRDLVHRIIAPYREEGAFSIAGENIAVPARTAVAVGMTLHELCTNAVKYGSLSRSGRVLIDWTAETDRLSLTWREIGGPPVRPPAQRGFGTTLIERGMPGAAGGTAELQFDPAGVVCRLVMPLR